MAERPRTELHAAAEPAHHCARSEQPRHMPEAFVVIGHDGVLDSLGAEPRLDLGPCERRSEKGASHRIGRLGRAVVPEHLVPEVQGSADCAAGIAAGRLNPDVVEGPVTEKSTVGNAVERDTTADAQPVEARLAVQFAGHGQDDLFEHDLSRCRDVGVSASQRLVRAAGRVAQQLLEPAVDRPPAIDVREVVLIQFDRTIRPDVDHLVENPLRERWFTERSEPHEFTLARVDPEPAIRGERRIQQPDRIGKAELAIDSESVASTPPERGGRPFADSVDGQDRRVIER